MNTLIKDFDVSILEIDTESNMVNLTRIAKHFGKNVKDWSRNKGTQEFLDAYQAFNGDRQILLSVRGFETEQGTWAVRQVAIEFAQWISPAFKVFCIQKLDELFQTGKTEIKTVSKKELAYMLIESETAREMAEEQVRLLTETIKEQAPKVIFLEEVLATKNTWPITLIATELGMSAVALNKKLQEKGIHRKVSGVWVLNAEYSDNGFTGTRTHTYTTQTGETRTSLLTVWTEKGRAFIHSLLNEKLNKSLQPA
jgi:phage antirepressor YoqD-like protein